MGLQMNSSGNPHGAVPALLGADYRARYLYRILRIHYSEESMWNIEQRFSPKAIESMAALGVALGSTRGVGRGEKYGCGAEFRKGPHDLYQMTVSPTIKLKRHFT